MSASTLPLASGVKELQTIEPPSNVVSMFERLLKDPTVDVEKLERLMAMQERILAHNAKADFYADFAQMQAELPTVSERGMTNNGAYALHEDIVEAVRPVLKKYGFILMFRTQFPEGSVKVIGVLAHRAGHAEETEFISRPDSSGNKNEIQARGSAQSYGQRYTTRALLNIASRKDDDDGRKTGGKKEPDAPENYDPWFATLEGVADEGMRRWDEAWTKSPEPFRAHLAATAPKVLAMLKTRAARVRR